jgi:hypothetical protein
MKKYNKCIICKKGISYYSKYCRKHYIIYILKNTIFHPCYKHGLRKKGHHCKLCGNVIYYKSKHCNTCNRQIQSTKIKGINNPNYKNGSYCNNHCIDCNESIKQQRKRCYQCNLIFKKSQRGKQNPNWKGGIGRLPYSYDFKINRKLVLKRDNYTCQKCNKKGTHVHHIDYNKQNCKKSNLISLCCKCNSEVNGNRDYWYAYFTYIMENK